ncbi:MAG: hypothetical protein RL338_979 [Chloroflexota bacterium]|jgi:hypothetical protein
MTPAADPYRVLGLAPGAPLDEVKRAYRRLAKEAHPDAAGTAATARFIALQRAYESIVRTPSGGRRPVSPRPRGRSGSAGAGAQGSAGPAGAGGTGSGSAGAGAGAASAGPGGSGATGGARKARGATGRRTAGSGGSTRPKGHRPARPTEPVRARLGTTTYDGVGGEDESWHGANWYGVSTGTYWTINPKEYADPRKHGPEYLARGRRPVAKRYVPPAEPAPTRPAPAAAAPRAAGATRPSGSATGLRGLLRRLRIGG